MLIVTRASKGMPTIGLKNTQATAIVATERVRPDNDAKRKAASPTTDDSKEPTSGIQAISAIIGANSR